MTERGEYRFKAKEFHDGKPWIAFEPAGNKLKGFSGLLGFDLKKGTTLEKAKEIERYLNDNIRALSVTAA